MKKIIIAILLCAMHFCVQAQVYSTPPDYPSALSGAANITAIEYFFDTDPGFGNATAIPLNAPYIGVTDIANASFTISFPAVFSNKVHTLYIRVKDGNGNWSIVNVAKIDNAAQTAYPPALAAATNMGGAEYFFDTDPGFKNGFQLTFAGNSTDVNGLSASLSFPVGFENKVHNCFIRTYDANGNWSITNMSKFDYSVQTPYPSALNAATTIKRIEYFFDTDPGFGNATPVSISAGQAIINNFNFTANFPTVFSKKVHTLCVRVQDMDGNWSIVNVAKIDNAAQTPYPSALASANPITNVEYFIDADPGFGNATALKVSTPASSVTMPDSIIKFGGMLGAGTHNLFLRSKQFDKWSITNQKSFLVYASPYDVSPDFVNFNNVAIGFNKTDSFVIKNVSTSPQTVNSIAMPTDFTCLTAFPITIAALSQTTVKINFAPTQQIYYSSTANITTPSGTETVLLQGRGETANPSWGITPATVYNFGDVVKNATVNSNFYVYNTGNTPITIASATVSGTGAAAYTTSIVGSSNIAIGSYGTVRVSFTPTANTNYNAVVSINASSPSTLTATTLQVTGEGYTNATKPTLQFVSALPYSDVRGVGPEAGYPGTYTYKVVYKSSIGAAPASGYPQVGLDLNGDGKFDGAGEALYSMTPETDATNYATGVVYYYTTTHSNFSNTLGYQFVARDTNNNKAVAGAVNYLSGPVITDQILDLQIFASDISFSNYNPNANQIFTVSAVVRNNGPFTITNVPIKFYKDSVYLTSGVIASIAPFSEATISKNLSFGSDGFYPIKVWIDSSQTLGESNILNNYAIRPVKVGLFSLPGGITVGTNATVTNRCVGGTRVYQLLIRDTARYYGIADGVSDKVAGATVTMVNNGNVYTTTTNAYGAYSYLFEFGGNCGFDFNFKVVVTDYTLTSDSTAGAATIYCNAMPCYNAPANPPPSIIRAAIVTPCEKPVAGQNFTMNANYSYRARNTNFIGSSNDYILWDSITVTVDGEPYERYVGGVLDVSNSSPFKQYLRFSNNASTIGGNPNHPVTTINDQRPGQTRTLPITVNIPTAGNKVIRLIHSYTYKEFKTRLFQEPGNPSYGVLYEEGELTGTYPFHSDTYTIDAGEAEYKISDTTEFTTSLLPQVPNLKPSYFAQTGYNGFSVDEYNNSCVDVNTMHSVKIYDSAWGSAAYVLNKTVTVNSLIAGGRFNITSTVSSYGYHTIKVVADANAQVTETNETDNQESYVVYFAKPDYIIDSFRVSTASIAIGGSVNFTAYIRNAGSAASASSSITFSKNGTVFSTKTIPALAAGGKATLVSDVVSITNNDNGCGLGIKVVANSTQSLPEENYNNNSDTMFYGADPTPKLLLYETGSNPTYALEIPINYSSKIPVPIRNNGARNVSNVGVQYAIKSTGAVIGTTSVASVKAGGITPTYANINATFTTMGLVELRIVTDPALNICQPNRNNDTASFWIRVIDGKPDFELLSQYISPSNLNPGPGQTITIVGTVKNVGTKTTTANKVKFYVDDVQLGAAVNINAIKAGRDTTVSATVSYTATPVGIRIMKMSVDDDSTESEIREDNNLATRALVVGAAPDFARAKSEGITLSASNVAVGTNTDISLYLRNYGGANGSGVINFYVADSLGNRTFIASKLFTLNSLDSARFSIPWVITTTNGRIITTIDDANPAEFNLFNNTDSTDIAKTLLPSPITTNNAQGFLSCTLGAINYLYNGTSGGVWSSSNTAVATIAANGSVTAISNGTTTITYTKGSLSASVIFTVAAQAVPAAITGASTVCIGANSTYTSATTGGVWVSLNNRATINSVSGILTGANAGTASITYTVTNSNGCKAMASSNVSIVSNPSVPGIGYAPGTPNPQYGASAGGYCTNRTFTVVGTPSGGVWSTTGTLTVNPTTGVVNTGTIAGAATLKYTYFSGGCSNSRTISGNVVTCATRGEQPTNVYTQLSTFDFTIYPNPAKSVTSLFVEKLIGEGSIVITDLFGKEVKKQYLSMGTNSIDVSRLSKGMYFVSVITKAGKNTKKLVIE